MIINSIETTSLVIAAVLLGHCQIIYGERKMKKMFLIAAGLALALGSTNASAADVEAGKKIFKKCKACHSLNPGKKKVGPSLHGVIGNKAGKMKGFKYSKAMKKAEITWDDASLDSYLTKPRKFLKGTRMSFAGLKKKKDRDNVIAYIKANTK
ncbi:MAG: cytochrome c family protein [Pseudomonadota bacterium]|nr:cytochrome c family protein [Pseudomonadota bacterium]